MTLEEIEAKLKTIDIKLKRIMPRLTSTFMQYCPRPSEAKIERYKKSRPNTVFLLLDYLELTDEEKCLKKIKKEILSNQS